MARIDTVNNPTPCQVATDASRNTVINYPGATGITAFWIRRQDGQPINATISDIRITSNHNSQLNVVNTAAIEDVISVSASQLVIRLEPSTKYQVRVMNQTNAGAHWTQWTTPKLFKTPNKRYYSPAAIRSDDAVLQTPVTQKENATFRIDNNASETVTDSSIGADVVVTRHPVGDVAGNPSIRTTNNTSVTQSGKYRGNRQRPGAVITTRCAAPARTGSRSRNRNYYAPSKSG